MMGYLEKSIILCLLLGVINCEKYSEDEYEVIEGLANSLGVKSLAFVQNTSHLNILKDIKNIFMYNVYSAFYNAKELEDILGRATATKYFERKTLIVTKDNLNFSKLIQKVSGPTLVYWLVFTDDLEEIGADYIPMNADLFAVRLTSREVVIDKLYHLKPGRNLSTKNIGLWPKFSDHVYISSLLVPEKIDYINFENLSLRALVYWNKDFCSSPGPKLALDRMECFHHEMMEITAQKLNFTIIKFECPERTYPYNYPNGTLSELFGILNRREADLSSASYVIDVNRLDYYDFAWPTFTTRSMMYIKLEGRTPHWQAYLRPLNFRIWVAIGSWVVVAGILIQIFEILRSGRYKYWKIIIFETTKKILIILQIFCNQGTHSTPRWYSNRLVYLATFFISLTIYQGYSGHLISSLTIVVPHIPFTDLQTFFQDKTYKLMPLRTGYHHYYLQKILDEKGITGLMLDSDELPFYSDQGIAKLCSQDNIAFVEFRENLAQHDLPCKITEIPRPMLYQSIGIGFPKNSPYQEFIKRELTLLHSTGILQRMRTHLYSYVKLEEKDKSNEDYVAVSLRQVAPLFSLLCLGLFLSFCLFLLELLHHKLHPH